MTNRIVPDAVKYRSTPCACAPIGESNSPADAYSDFNNYCILPGFTDVHVHLREPGFLYKETIATGTRAAAAGGFTSICTMPNLKPCPDSPENLKLQLEAIERDAIVNVYPYGSITVGEHGNMLADMAGLAGKQGQANTGGVIAFTDDGVGVMSDDLMKKAMIQAKALGKMIVAHCEDTNWPRESREAEYKQLERDLDLVRGTGCAYHVCHISTAESVELVRRAKAEGLDVTCETAPHYLLLSGKDIEDHGRFKMNPPIKEEADRLALIAGLQDGTIDMIATDHAPHSKEEKDCPFADAAFGIVGLETAFPVLYTKLVLENVITLDKLVDLMSGAPNRRFGIGSRAAHADSRAAAISSQTVGAGTEALTDYALWDLDTEYEISPDQFETKGRATPFDGWKVRGRCMKTFINGTEIWSR